MSGKDGGWILPTVIDPPRICIQLSIPNEYNHLRAFWGALFELTYWWNWQRDPDKKGKAVAKVWESVWREAIASHDCEGDMPFDIKFDGCNLLYSKDNWLTQHEVPGWNDPEYGVAPCFTYGLTDGVWYDAATCRLMGRNKGNPTPYVIVDFHSVGCIEGGSGGLPENFDIVMTGGVLQWTPDGVTFHNVNGMSDYRKVRYTQSCGLEQFIGTSWEEIFNNAQLLSCIDPHIKEATGKDVPTTPIDAQRCDMAYYTFYAIANEFKLALDDLVTYIIPLISPFFWAGRYIDKRNDDMWEWSSWNSLSTWALSWYPQPDTAIQAEVDKILLDDYSNHSWKLAKCLYDHITPGEVFTEEDRDAVVTDMQALTGDEVHLWGGFAAFVSIIPLWWIQKELLFSALETPGTGNCSPWGISGVSSRVAFVRRTASLTEGDVYNVQIQYRGSGNCPADKTVYLSAMYSTIGHSEYDFNETLVIPAGTAPGTLFPVQINIYSDLITEDTELLNLTLSSFDIEIETGCNQFTAFIRDSGWEFRIGGQWGIPAFCSPATQNQAMLTNYPEHSVMSVFDNGYVKDGGEGIETANWHAADAVIWIPWGDTWPASGRNSIAGNSITMDAEAHRGTVSIQWQWVARKSNGTNANGGNGGPCYGCSEENYQMVTTTGINNLVDTTGIFVRVSSFRDVNAWPSPVHSTIKEIVLKGTGTVPPNFR